MPIGMAFPTSLNCSSGRIPTKADTDGDGCPMAIEVKGYASSPVLRNTDARYLWRRRRGRIA